MSYVEELEWGRRARTCAYMASQPATLFPKHPVVCSDSGWTEFNTDKPSARSDFALTKRGLKSDVAILFGGLNAVDLATGEMYVFNLTKDNSWAQVHASSESGCPSSRSAARMAYQWPYVYLHGGQAGSTKLLDFFRRNVSKLEEELGVPYLPDPDYSIPPPIEVHTDTGLEPQPCVYNGAPCSVVVPVSFP